ncbi:tyrosine-type recombinase/integrase [Kiloniella litopenaei]|uniref:tyrosine-type recombinase/integrase n=1 Tax=Kiloniella litopenaei TaxID=1549748 RepID=UPI0012FEBFE4|nr:tyrosine-type recombinase/integrase [Kiloniella litopenaei]
MRDTTVLTLPIKDTNVKAWSQIQMPVLFIETDGTAEPYRELVDYIFNSLASGQMAQESATKCVRAVERFIKFYDTILEHNFVIYEELNLLLSIFTIFRHKGSNHEEAGPEFSDLNWAPVETRTARNDFNAIVNFFDFCNIQYGYITFQKEKISTKNSSWYQSLEAVQKKKDRDFFTHLSAHRARFKMLQPDMEVPFPKILKTKSAPPTNEAEKAISQEEIKTIIAAERNPVFRFVWIITSFGGIRLSEACHIWQADVMPSFYWKELFQVASNKPLIFRSEPSDCKYTGTIGSYKITRRKYLKNKYGLIPRNEYPIDNIQHAGWKGVTYTDDRLFHPIFWQAGHDIIDLLNEAIKEIQTFHSINRTSKTHPYFLVNMRPGQHFGQPTSRSNIQNAWNRACIRVGLKPHEHRRNIHAGRHLHTALSRELDMSDRSIQEMLGHSSIKSQNSYGKSLRLTAEKLEKAHFRKSNNEEE